MSDINTTKLQQFLSNREGDTDWETDKMKRHLLSGGWAQSTLESYNAGINKFEKFTLETGRTRKDMLPAEEETIYDFVVWMGRKPGQTEKEQKEQQKISASTIEKYLTAVKCWHLFHGEPFPKLHDHKLKLLMKVAKKGDAELVDIRKEQKKPVLLSHLEKLVYTLTSGDRRDQAVLTVALVAFWGMARLGELVSDNKTKRMPKLRDLTWGKDGETLAIALVQAKTARPGQLQFLHLTRRYSLLDPVGAIRRLVDNNATGNNDSIFSYLNEKGTRMTLSKSTTLQVLKKSWGNDRLTGHSFRVGGASLRWNEGTSIPTIQNIGRWESKAYQLYLRTYTTEEKKETREVWERMRVEKN